LIKKQGLKNSPTSGEFFCSGISGFGLIEEEMAE